MALKVVQGGTTGAADGTLVSGGNPIVFTGIDVVVDAHIRADDDTYAAPAQFVAATTAGPAVGKGDVQVSVDGGSTWKSWSDNPYSIVTGIGGAGLDLGDLNFPIKLRQHAASPPGDTSGSFDTDGTLTSATALGDVTGFAAAGAAATGAIDVSWSAVANRTRYQVDRATNSGFTTGVTLGVYTGTGTSFTDSGLTGGTTYYYRIKAIGTYRFKDSANYATATANATAVSYLFSDTFSSGSSPDSTRFGTAVAAAGAVSVGAGVCLLDGGATADVALLYIKPKIPPLATLASIKYKARVRNKNGSWGSTAWNYLLVRTDGSVPAANASSVADVGIRVTYNDNGADKGIVVYYWNPSNAAQSSPATGGAFHAYSGTDVTFPIAGIAATDFVSVELEVDNTNSRWRVNAWNAAGTSLGSTPWVLFSDTRGWVANDKYVMFGDPWNDFIAVDHEVDSVDVS